ncbi:MAG TPA: cytochrome C [Myxococcota bacterium]|jgi:mono/diheme cytochrome c family protein|nr:cytochrome C [Myxococcota bacterium]
MEHRTRASSRRSWTLAFLVVITLFGAGGYFLRQRLRAPDAELVAGRADYARWCAPCHGEDARGGGPLAAKLERRPSDLTLIAKREGGTFRVDDLIGYIDGRAMEKLHRSREMPEWGPIFEATMAGDPDTSARARERLRSITIYLWTLQR